ncbi:MAG: collagen-like triple helix repeat-containing protein [Thermodesulfobacteriota bacterium]
MATFIYDQLGNPVAFIEGEYVHSILGQAIGQIRDTHIHKISGEYVGELYESMVVDMNIGDLGSIGHQGDPGNPGFKGIPGNRGVIDTEYTDVFFKLIERVNYIDESIRSFSYRIV